MEKLLKEIRHFLKSNENPELVKKYSYYFKEGYDAYGVPQDILFAQKEIWLKELKENHDIDFVLDLGAKLLATGIYEEGSLAILFLSKFKKDFKKEHIEKIGMWLDSGVRNWAHSDYLCGEIISVFYEKKIMTYNDVEHWRFAESRWKRRSVPVGMLKLLKLTPDYNDILAFLDPMMEEKERVVHQGIGWFLRECWKKEPAVVEEFLLKWKDTSARLIFQYACEKMTKEHKEKFKKVKKN